MIDIQQDITVMGGREVSRPYRVWFFAEGGQRAGNMSKACPYVIIELIFEATSHSYPRFEAVRSSHRRRRCR
ncbi:MAG: hypothetical protein SPJ38_03725, partial [Sodaliphilus sp.]|nr:hypothetical protein [Sodaliphilus sp.]